MARKPLTNAGWGFETNCFVCEPANPRGLHVAFFHDTEAEVVTAEFRLDVAHSGAPHYVHGGVLLAVMDEAMAWAAIALAGRFAVVQSTATTFDRPVRIDELHRVEASVHGSTDTAVTARAFIADAAGRRCARARARLVVLSTAVAGSAIGPVTGADIRRFALDHIADFKAPQFVVVRADPLPRNAGGKVLKPVLRDETDWGEQIR